jgi:hypothetical protein
LAKYGEAWRAVLCSAVLASQASPRFAKVRQGSPRFAKVRQGSPRFAKVRQGSPRFANVRQGSPRFAKVRQGSPRFAKVRQGSPRFANVRQGSPRFAKVRQGSPRFAKLYLALALKKNQKYCFGELGNTTAMNLNLIYLLFRLFKAIYSYCNSRRKSFRKRHNLA